MNPLKEMLSEPSGKLSSKRVLSTALIITFIISYIYTVITTHTIVDIPNNWGLLIFGILGLLSTTSIMARKNENK